MARDFVTSQHEFLRYYLYYNGIEYPINPADNWEDAQKEIARSAQYKGMMVTLSDSVTFSGYAANLLKTWYKDGGIIAEVRIVEYELNDHTDEWEEAFSGYLDYSEWTETDTEVTLMINSESVQKKLSSRYQTEIDIDSLTDLDGVTHGYGRTKRTVIEMDDRDILGEAILDIGTPYKSKDATTRNAACIIFSDRKESYNGDIPRTYEVLQEGLVVNSANPNNLCFYNQQSVVDPNGDPVDRQITFDLRVKATFEIPNGTALGSSVSLKIAFYDLAEDVNGDVDLTFVSAENLETVSFLGGKSYQLTFDKSLSYNMPYERGVAIYFDHEFATITNSDWEYNIEQASVNIWGPVRATATTSETLLPYDLFEKMIRLIGGKSISSEYLSNSRLAVTNGYMIRNVVGSDGNKPPFQITFEKLYNSFDSIEPIGLAVNGSQVQIEKREYFYQKFFSFDFEDKVSNVKYEVDKEQAFSEITIGFDTSNFSREGALSEFNVKSTWVSPINTYKKELNMVANIMASHNTIETLRRVQYQESVERTHTRQGDSTNYFIDLKDNRNKPRTWKDDFSVVKGLKFLDSVFNLRLSPMNRLRKQGQWINFGYSQFANRFLTFSSSTGATGMITQPINDTPIAENESIRISDAGVPRFLSEKVTFEIEPQNFYQLLQERVDGIKKAYGLFRFTHRGEVVYGYLESYKVETKEVKLQVVERIPITQ